MGAGGGGAVTAAMAPPNDRWPATAFLWEAHAGHPACMLTIGMVSWRQLLRRSMVSASVAAVEMTASSTGLPSPSDGQGCVAWDVTYAVSGNLQLRDTPSGAGDGTYAIGPGKVVLRYDARAGRVTMLSFDLPERFGIVANKLFWTAHLDTDAAARAAPAAGAGQCGHVAEGTMQGRTVVWATRVRALRTDGVVDCKGSLCGSFGAPPKGTSPIHIGPDDVQLQPFEFGPDGKTFTMSSSFVSKTEAPRQASYLAMSGREVRRTCAPIASCR
jgi:hypothetical protein